MSEWVRSVLTDSNEGSETLWEIKSSYAKFAERAGNLIYPAKSLCQSNLGSASLKSQGLGAGCLLAAGALAASCHWVKMEAAALVENNVWPKPGLY